jgi:hypothetical protein
LFIHESREHHMPNYVIGFKCEPKTAGGRNAARAARKQLASRIESLGSVLALCSSAWLLQTRALYDQVQDAAAGDAVSWDLLMGEERVPYFILIVEVRRGDTQGVCGPFEYGGREEAYQWIKRYF